MHQVLHLQSRAACNVVREAFLTDMIEVIRTNVTLSTLPTSGFVRVEHLRIHSNTFEVRIVQVLISDPQVDRIGEVG